MAAYLYILYSEKLNKFDVGSTIDINRRIAEHNRGKGKFTKTGLPWELKYKEVFAELIDARRRELFIKNKKAEDLLRNLLAQWDKYFFHYINFFVKIKNQFF